MAWIHFEQSAILTVHNHVITRNPRISVTHDKHDKHKTWFLHINNVKEEDRGRYMCQINTVTAKTQFGYLHVVGKLRHNMHSYDLAAISIYSTIFTARTPTIYIQLSCYYYLQCKLACSYCKHTLAAIIVAYCFTTLVAIHTRRPSCFHYDSVLDLLAVISKE